MKRTVLLLLSTIFVTGLFAQKSPIKGFDVDKKSGVLYKFEIKNPTGQKVGRDDLIIGKFWISFGDSLVNDGNKMESQPILATTSEANVFKGDLIDGVLLMRKGEKCKFAFERDSIAKLFPELPSYFVKGMYAYWSIQIDDIQSKEEVMAEEAEMQKEQEKLMGERKLMADSLIKLEPKIIQDAIKTYGIEDKIKDGIYFKQLFFGNNKTKIENGDIVRVHYAGKFVNGDLFDTSIEEEAKKHNKHQAGRKYEPLEFTVGQGMMIQGFEAGVKMMSKSDKGILLIPSSLAYGELGRGEIMPASPLIFEIEIIEIIKDNAEQKQNQIKIIK